MQIRDLFQLSKNNDIVHIQVQPYPYKLTVDGVITELKAAGYGNYFIYSDQIKAAAQAINRISYEIYSENKEGETFLIAMCRDADCKISVSKNKMQAILQYSHAFGGETPAYFEILDVLQQQLIVYGIDDQGIQEFLAGLDNMSPGQRATCVVANGQPAENGRNSRFEPLISHQSQMEFSPEYKGLSDKIELRKSKKIFTVSEGTNLMMKHPATNGKPGMDVYGKEVLPTSGIDLEFTVYPGSRINPNEPNFLEASHGGMPRIYYDGVSVLNTLTVDSVDSRTGDIVFDGNLEVRGDVLAGMQVQVTGNITVFGTVEDAEIEAGGDIVVKNGIIGKDREDEEFSCRLTAQGKISGIFAQYVRLEADDDIKFQQHVYHSVVYTRGRLVVGDNVHRVGTVMGGLIFADKGLTAVHIGNKSGVNTRIEVFPDFRKIGKAIFITEEELAKQEGLLASALDVEKKVLMLPKRAQKQSVVQKVTATVTHYQTKVNVLRMTIKRYKQRLEKEGINNTVHCYGRIYPGTEIHMGESKLVVQNEHAGKKFNLINRRIRVDTV